MAKIIAVRLTEDDKFEVIDLDTGKQKVFCSSVLHTPAFIASSSVKDFFCEEFPGATDWQCSADALERINGICDFNCLTDEVRF